MTPFPTLTDAQRQQARLAARQAIVKQYAVRAHRADYHDWAVSRYPRWLVWGISAALVVVALAAGLISAFRLYYAGHDYFLRTLPNRTLAEVVGYATPLAAEVLVIVAAIGGRVYMAGRGRWLALLPVSVGMVVAFVGNWQITRPDTLWGWVETLFPPLAVLSVAYMAEVAFMPELERRAANERAYRAARAAYDALVTDPEGHDRWRATFAAALWDMWRKVYAQHDPDALDVATRVEIVRAELAAGAWIEEAGLAGATGDLQRLAGATTRSSGASNRAIVEAFYAEHPDGLQMQQREIAELLQVSESAVSRYKPSTNGQGGEHAARHSS